VGCKYWASACRDLIGVTLEKAQTESLRVDGETTQALYDSCLNSFNPKAELTPNQESLNPSNRNNFLALITVFAEKKLFLPTFNDPLYQLVTFMMRDQNFSSQLLNQLLSMPQIYVTSGIPTIMEESLSPDNQLTYGEQFLHAFRKTPLTSFQIGMLDRLLKQKIAAKDLKGAENLLNTYLPFSETLSQNEEASQLWEFFWLELNEESFHSPQKPQVEAWLKSLNLASLSDIRRLRALAISLHFDLVEFLWRNWAQFEKVAHNNSQVLQVFYNKTLAQLSSKSLSPEHLERFEAGKMLIRVSQDDPTLTPVQIKKVLGSSVSIKDDLSYLEQFRAISRKLGKSTLKLNGYLPQVLRSKLKNFQTEENLLISSSWTHERYQSEAKSIFVKDGQSIISQIKAVQSSAHGKKDLLELVAQLNEISKEIEAKLSQLEQDSSKENVK
jgi:hypothetical protein